MQLDVDQKLNTLVCKIETYSKHLEAPITSVVVVLNKLILKKQDFNVKRESLNTCLKQCQPWLFSVAA